MVVHKYIVHVLDRNSEGPILNDFEGKNNAEVDKFFEKLINKVAKDDDLRKAVFKDYSDNLIKNCCEQIIYDADTFVQNSKEIASYLFLSAILIFSLAESRIAFALSTASL